MLYRTHPLSSSINAFTQEWKKLEQLFLELKYPGNLIKSITKKFLDDPQTKPTTSVKPQVTRIVLPFKNQPSAIIVRCQITEMLSRTGVQFFPVFTSRKLNDVLKPAEPKPALISRQKLYITLNVTSVRLVMLATPADTYINVLKKMREKPPSLRSNAIMSISRLY